MDRRYTTGLLMLAALTGWLACDDSERQRLIAAADAQARSDRIARLAEATPAARTATCTPKQAKLWAGTLKPGMLVKRWQIEVDTATVFVDPDFWSRVSLDARTGLSKYVSLCLAPDKAPEQLRFVSWRRANTGVELGVWSSLGDPSGWGSYRSRNE